MFIDEDICIEIKTNVFPLKYCGYFLMLATVCILACIHINLLVIAL